jgi:hypothetical protein
VLSTSLVTVLPLAGLPTCSLQAAAVPASTPESFTSRVSGSVSRLTSFYGASKGAPGKPRQGTFTITFAIYPVPEVGDPLWTETQQMTATPEGSHTEQPRSSASGGLPATVFDPLNRFNDAPVFYAEDADIRARSIIATTVGGACKPARHHFLFFGGVFDWGRQGQGITT